MRRQTLCIFALSAIALSGCQKNEFNNSSDTGDVTVRYAVTTGLTTKAESAEETATEISDEAEGTTLVLSDASGNLNIPMGCEVTEGITGNAVSAVTKGTQVNTTGDDNKTLETFANIVGSFVAEAYDSEGTQKVSQTVTWDESSNAWVGSPVTYWSQGTSLNFLAYANLPGSQTATIASTGVSTEHTVPATAADQTDILFGHYQGNGGNTGTAEIRFDHPLTAVRFKYGTMDGDPVIKSISIDGVAESGTATKSPDGTITWGGVDSHDYTVSQSDGSGLSVDATTSVIGEPFLIIPQNLSENAVKVTVTFIDGTVVEGTITSGEWKAGVTYTYGLYLDNDYVLKVLPNVSPLPYTGGSVSFSVESYSTTGDGSSRAAVPWTLEYYDINQKKWFPLNASTVPSTLFDDTHTFSTFSGNGISTPGSKEDVAVGVKAGAKETIVIAAEDHTKILRNAPVVGTEDAPYDLSMHTVNGESRASGAPVTANCYVVAAGGWYCLPLVYGNSYNGSTTPNTVAYAPTATTNKNTYLTPFRNAIGTIDPACGGFIETDTGASLTTAELQWEDLPVEGTPTMLGTTDIIAAPEGAPLNCRYLRFYIKPETIRQGNIVIKVTDGTTSYWSWHIWVIDDPISTLPVRYGNNDSQTIETMTFNLGWSDGSETLLSQYAGGDLRIRVRQTSAREPEADDEVFISRTAKILSLQSTDGGSTYYQWGRKDPMVPGVHISDFTSKPYLGNFYKLDRSKTINEHTIAFGIKNPGAALGDLSADDGMWYYEGYGETTTKANYYNLWDADQTSNSTDRETVKTIYDPCPPGFKVPRKNAYNYMSTGNAIGGFNAGYLFKKTSADTEGMFFFAAGYRNHNYFNLSSMGTYGHYWTAIAASAAGEATLLRFKDGTVQKTDTEQQCNGYSIRPVAE